MYFIYISKNKTNSKKDESNNKETPQKEEKSSNDTATHTIKQTNNNKKDTETNPNIEKSTDDIDETITEKTKTHDELFNEFIEKHLTENEKEIARLIKEKEGITQYDILNHIPKLTKSNLSKIISKLDAKKILKRIKVGKVNNIYLGERLEHPKE